MANCVFHGKQAARIQSVPDTPPPLIPTVTQEALTSFLPSTEIDESDIATALPSTDLRVPENFFKLTGRTRVWRKGIDQFLETPILGIGFNGDRLAFGAHIHNSYLQALVQTGLLGVIPFSGAIIYAWILLWRLMKKLNQIPPARKHLVIQAAGVLAFLSVRTITESTGAFFGVDWLLLAPVFLYLQVVGRTYNDYEVESEAK